MLYYTYLVNTIALFAGHVFFGTGTAAGPVCCAALAKGPVFTHTSVHPTITLKTTKNAEG